MGGNYESKASLELMLEKREGTVTCSSPAILASRVSAIYTCTSVTDVVLFGSHRMTT